MSPYLRDGDQVEIMKVNEDELGVGDLITFERNHTLYTHRVIKKTHEWIVTKGDNQLFPDPPLAPQAVLGKVIAYQRDGKRYNLQGKRYRIHQLLGLGHAVVGQVNLGLLAVSQLTSGKLKRPLLWVSKGILKSMKLIERLLMYVE